MPTRSDAQVRLRLRVVVVAPPPGVWFSLQPEPGVFEQRQLSSNGDLAFALEVRVAEPIPAKGAARLLGAYVKGPPDKRFLYIGVGKHAGDADSCWDRRIKVPLTNITRDLVHGASAGRALEARVAGTDRKGEPACATVPLLAPGWRLVDATSR